MQAPPLNPTPRATPARAGDAELGAAALLTHPNRHTIATQGAYFMPQLPLRAASVDISAVSPGRRLLSPLVHRWGCTSGLSQQCKA